MPLSKLPFWVLYRLSDLMFVLVYYVVRYRKRVVFENLKSAFPEKTDRELKAISRAFFRHFCDVIIESVRAFSISNDEILRRYRYLNPELLEQYYQKGQSLTALGAHYGNWEWVGITTPLYTKHKVFGIYQTLTNQMMDQLVRDSRGRNGSTLISTEKVAAMLRERHKECILTGYIADQSPGRHARKHWMQFLGQDTPVSTGFEFFAKEYNTPVVFLSIEKVRRGYYEGTFHTITDEPRNTQPGEIIEAYMRLLEAKIRKQPEFWLWSHRRWKLKR